MFFVKAVQDLTEQQTLAFDTNMEAAFVQSKEGKSQFYYNFLCWLQRLCGVVCRGYLELVAVALCSWLWRLLKVLFNVDDQFQSNISC